VGSFNPRAGSLLMMIALHKNARTTPAIRAEIVVSTDSIVALTRRYGISEPTARKWRKRSSPPSVSSFTSLN